MATTSRERQAAWRERIRQQQTYLAALEAAVCDAADCPDDCWTYDHAPTIARARAARGTAATTTED